MENKRNIHIGTSGWSYKHWKGVFYPPGLKAAAQLSYYASHYEATEINSSFYKLPSPATVENWIRSVPEGFLFCPKMSRFLSHMKKLHDPAEPLQRFFSIFGPFAAHIGPVLIQLPDSLRFNDAVAREFYTELLTNYPEFRFAMEVRHDTWLSEESVGLMRRFKITLVIAQSERYPYHEEITARDIFFRLHGPERLYSSAYAEEVLADYAAKFVTWEKSGHIVWAFFNNDVHGHALHNATRLRELVNAF